MNRKILHCDMNNCYASIEERKEPRLRGTCMVVGGSEDDRQGIVLSKNKKARALGIKTGESLLEARIKCPDLVVVKPHYEDYLAASKQAREIYYSFTNLVESFGLDECFLDVSGSAIFGDEYTIAENIKNRIKKEMGITISVGISYNKVFAKLSGDLAGYDECFTIKEEELKDKVWPLKVDLICGIGRKTAGKLHIMNIHTIGELAKTNPDIIRKKLGVSGLEIWDWANGRDYRKVCDFNKKEEVKSLGRGTTFREDLVSLVEVEEAFLRLATYVCDELKKHRKVANGIEISIKDSKLETKIFQKKINFSTNSITEIYMGACEIFEERYRWNYGIRAITLRGIYLEEDRGLIPLNFLPENIKIRKIRLADKLMYDLNGKYDKRLLFFASILKGNKFPAKLNDIVTLPGAFLR